MAAHVLAAHLAAHLADPRRGSIRTTLYGYLSQVLPTTDGGGEAVRGTERGLGSQQALTKSYSCMCCFAARIH
jgi:hypothetical protein